MIIKKWRTQKQLLRGTSLTTSRSVATPFDQNIHTYKNERRVFNLDTANINYEDIRKKAIKIATSGTSSSIFDIVGGFFRVALRRGASWTKSKCPSSKFELLIITTPTPDRDLSFTNKHDSLMCHYYL